ncbi:MAG: polyprenyl synthetase family protein [Candidatus Omnitrophota bacterium]
MNTGPGYVTIVAVLKTIIKHIDQHLEKFLNKIRHDYYLHQVDPILYESIKDYALRKGKRIRPLLLILSYQGYKHKKNGPSRSLYDASTCMELLHIFMLVHDDIIDRSDLRRGQPTMHRLLRKAAKTKEQDKLGYDLSIVTGDILYSLAIDAFLSIREDPLRKEKALKYFIRTAAFTAIGEFIDVLQGVKKIQNVSQKDVLLTYRLKTARYTFECPLVVGAILAGASQRETQRLSRFGSYLGQAFQIQDDILGIFDSQKNIGKSILSDLAESKKTILTCHAYEHLKGRQKKQFLYYFEKNKKTYADLMAIRKILIQSGSLSYSLRKMTGLLKKAHHIFPSLSMKKEYRAMINDSLNVLFVKSKIIAQANNISL